MESQEFISYLMPILALTGLTAGWMGVQILAKRMKTKNHIDHGGCCGAFSNKESCTKIGKVKQ
jgi:hypothetical protein